MELAREAARKHGSAELWVQHSDRLARGDGRSARHLGKIYFDLLEAGVQLRSVQDDDNLRDAIRTVLIGERNYEDSRRKSEAVRAGKARQLERGERLGGPVPDGYTRSLKQEGGQSISVYKPDPDRAPIIKRAFELASEGLGDPSVARALNREGHRTKSGRYWTRGRVQDLLTNPFYAGRVVRFRGKPDEQVREGQHPGLVASELFEELAAGRYRRDRGRGSGRNSGRPSRRFVLAGLVRCIRCGSRMYSVTSTYKRKDGTRRRHYVCAAYREGVGPCDQPKIDAEVIDRAVVAHLDGFFLDFDAWLRSVTETHDLNRSELNDVVSRRRERLETIRRREPRLRERWLAAMDAGDDRAERLAYEALEAQLKERDQLSEAVAAAEEALRQAEEAQPVDAMLDFFNDLAAAVRGAIGSDRVEEVNSGLREVLAAVRLRTGRRGVVAWFELRDDAAVWGLQHPDEQMMRLIPKGQGVRAAEAFGIDPWDPKGTIPTLITGEESIAPLVKPLRMAADEVSSPSPDLWGALEARLGS